MVQSVTPALIRLPKAQACVFPRHGKGDRDFRVPAGAWLRVRWRAWTDHEPYDPALHSGAIAPASNKGG
jgi:hypothetical protein